MKRVICLAVIVLGLSPVFSQILKLDTFIQSSVLDSMVLVDVILPLGYDTSLNTHYPVIYYYHGWTGNQNSDASMISYMYSYINSGYIEPFILVKPSAWCEPFEGSLYVNSVLWGNYQDFIAGELVEWVDSTFRTVPEKNYRGIIGNSMGCYGMFYVTRDHPEVFRAAAGHAGTGFLRSMKDSLRSLVLAEQSGQPPYTYIYSSPGGGQPWTAAQFLMCGAFAPNLSTTQTYLNPAVVDFPLDENGNAIDSIADKVLDNYPVNSVSQLNPADSISYLYSCGTMDDWLQFEASEAIVDSMNYYGIDVQWLPHSGDHFDLTLFKDKAYRFMDSVLGDPITLPNTHIPEVIDFPTIKIWPNPASDQLTLQIDQVNKKQVFVEIFDMEGRRTGLYQTYTGISGTNNFHQDIQPLAPGIYILHARCGHKHIYEKIVKQ